MGDIPNEHRMAKVKKEKEGTHAFTLGSDTSSTLGGRAAPT
jgi:hypothetical protein